MKVKIHVQHTYTKRDTYGNVYHAVKVTNVKNGNSFTADAVSLSNVTSILGRAFGAYTSDFAIISEECTGSARTSSLPKSEYLDQCRYKNDWKKALNAVGLRPRGAVEA